jgi:diguanylate cyclase (GGDEF)-like protein
MRMPPGWDGVETIRELWKVDPQLQIVICTAHSDYSWDDLLGQVGAEDRLLVLKKPFDNIEVAQLASALTTKWDLTRQAELKVSRLEDAVQERTQELEIANKELEALVGEVTQLATHDALTGLPNRLLFADRASQVLAVARREGSRPAVLMLDLDRFKEVNDTLGHQCGDVLLTRVAERLSRVLRPGDTVARFGGDEFAIVLSDGGSDAGTEVARRIAQTLEAPFSLNDSAVGIEASVGIAAVVSETQPSLEELLRQADIAMYKAKADRSGFAHFAACNDDGTPNRLTLMGELRQALDCEEIVVYYQPQIALDTGGLLAVEALVRWQHPTRGLLLPEQFIALAEGSTLIQRLTMVVIENVLRSCRGWLDQGLRLPVSVNVSARSLVDPQFPAMIGDRLTYAGVPASLLTLELTETTVMAYPGLALGILQKLRDLGVHLSVDDYGTGYSSMAYLKNLPVGELKIDQGFIKGLTTDPADVAIVQSATELGHSLGLSVVAEGVENERTLNMLKSMGIDVVQGYHLGHPMPESLLRSWIDNHAGTITSAPHLPNAT